MLTQALFHWHGLQENPGTYLGANGHRIWSPHESFDGTIWPRYGKLVASSFPCR